MAQVKVDLDKGDDLALATSAVSLKIYGRMTLEHQRFYKENLSNTIQLLDLDEVELKTNSFSNMYFAENTILQGIILPHGLKEIDGHLFKNCKSLRYVLIPKTVNYINPLAFCGCYKLKTLEVDKRNKNYCSVDGLLLSKEKLSLKLCFDPRCPENETTIYTVPKTVEWIDTNAFSYKSTLFSVILHNNISAISSHVFDSCENLRVMRLPNSINVIDDCVFMNCVSLETMEIPNSVEKIRKKAFFNCRSIKKLVIPENVNTIMDEAFASCTSLTEIKFSKNITVIENGVCKDCFKLYKVILSPNTEKISAEAFKGCAELELIEGHIGPNKLKFIGASAFESCIFLRDITLPESLIEISEMAFANCMLLQKIHITKHIYSIGKKTFYKCVSLKFVEFPEMLKTIDDDAFGECQSLRSVIMPDSVIDIGKNAFIGCISLKYVKFPVTLFAKGINEVFNNCGKIERIIISPYKQKLLKDYTKVMYESNDIFDTMIETESHLSKEDNYLNTLSQTTSNKGSNNISSSSQNIFISSFSDYPGLCSGNNNNLNIEVRNTKYPQEEEKEHCSVKNPSFVIPENAFNLPSKVMIQKTLQNVEIREGIISVNQAAFFGCTNLRSVKLPQSLKKICKGAFANCLKLQNINLHNNIETIGIDSFNNCKSLTQITIPKAVFKTGFDYIFKNCNSLTSVKIKDPSIVEIPEKTIKNSNIIKNIQIISPVKRIQRGAFLNLSSLENVIIPNCIFDTGFNRAFIDCNIIKTISIYGQSLFEIPSNSFISMDFLKTVLLWSENINSGESDIDLMANNLKTSSFIEVDDSPTEGHIDDISCIESNDTVLTSNSSDKKSLGIVVMAGAFKNCKSLKSVYFNGNLVSIERNAYENCPLISICDENEEAVLESEKDLQGIIYQR